MVRCVFFNGKPKPNIVYMFMPGSPEALCVVVISVEGAIKLGLSPAFCCLHCQ